MWGQSIRASSVEGRGRGCSVVLQMASEVSPTLWPFLLGVSRCHPRLGAGAASLISPLCPQPKPENAITIAVSSRALFRMEEEQKIYTEQGVEAYVKYQLDHENEPFLPGAAFPFVKVSTWSPKILGRGQSSCGERVDTSSRAEGMKAWSKQRAQKTSQQVMCCFQGWIFHLEPKN